VSRRLRVLSLVESVTGPRAGGAEHVAAHWAMHLDRSRFEPMLCATRLIAETGPLLDELRDADVPVLQLRRRRRADLAAWAPLVSLLRRERVDVVHAHMFGANVWGTVLGRLTRVPVIVAHEHSWSFEGSPLRRLLDRELIARGASVFVATSTEDRDKMVAIERVPFSKVRVLPNGIPPLRAPSGRDIRAELGIAPGAPLVGSVGELHPAKAFDVLIAATAALRSRFPELRVVVAGEGGDRGRLERAIEEHGVEGSFALLGRREDVPDLLAALDVAVSSSAREGSPLSVMEYMAAGLPVVATRVGGIPDLIDDGVHGLLVPPDDPEQLASAIERVLADEPLRLSLGEQARERQRREFDLGAAIRRVEALYEELYARTPRARREPV
jgi:glycosyltransferase involved in cell wall biosynthesis